MQTITLRTIDGAFIHQAQVPSLFPVVIWQSHAFLRVSDGYREIASCVIPDG
jgi:hypothetical protein